MKCAICGDPIESKDSLCNTCNELYEGYSKIDSRIYGIIFTHYSIILVIIFVSSFAPPIIGEDPPANWVFLPALLYVGFINFYFSNVQSKGIERLPKMLSKDLFTYHKQKVAVHKTLLGIILIILVSALGFLNFFGPMFS